MFIEETYESINSTQFGIIVAMHAYDTLIPQHWKTVVFMDTRNDEEKVFIPVNKDVKLIKSLSFVVA